MPLPKPSKTVSKRFKKRQPKLPLLPPPPHGTPPLPFPLPSEKQHCLLARELRVRVICADPDATDDSSSDDVNDDDDEGSRRGFQRTGRKRLVREIWLPSAPPLNLHSLGLEHEVQISTATRTSHPSPLSTGANQWRHSNKLPSSQQVRSSKLLKEMSCSQGDKEEQKQQLGWFFSGFGADDDMWDFGHDYVWRAHDERSCAGMLDPELDAEVLSWIDSLQGLP